MSADYFTEQTDAAIDIFVVRPDSFATLSSSFTDTQKAFADAHKFQAKVGELLVLPGAQGIGMVLFGMGDDKNPMVVRALPAKLPAGIYNLAATPEDIDTMQLCLAWAMGRYQFDRYKPRDGEAAKLIVPDDVDRKKLDVQIAASDLARDLVNTPACDMGPKELADVIKALAKRHKAKVTETIGNTLQKDYPLVYTVGKAATREPRMLEMHWGKTGPKIAIVGKGVIFDSGGLNIKGGSGMRHMKKDMGGAAHAIALSQMIMEAGLNVQLTLLVPCVENAIAGNAFRPGDIIKSRKGITVEIDNTDAEGRLILADALTRATELEPELTLDFATLTGAARVALGPDVIPYYTDDDGLAGELRNASTAVNDPLWQMPLWAGYRSALDSPVADVCHTASGVQAGSVTAALFLQKFAPDPWVHFDIYAANMRTRPGFAHGGECQAIRAVFEVLANRYG